MRVLVFTTLYPSAAQPRHGIFVETRLRQLLATKQIEARVLAPIPWFPFASPRFGEYAQHAKAPYSEERHGVRIEHPRYLVIPKVGRALTPTSLFRTAASAVRRMQDDGFDCDIIDAHFFYPDGVVATWLGELFNKPVFVTARGSDINVLSASPRPRRLIVEAARKTAMNITVSASLKHVMVTRLGVPPDRIAVLRNGVDLSVFHPVDRDSTRQRLGMAGRVVLSVGNLVTLKGHDLLIRAICDLPGAELWIVGEGEQRESLVALARMLGVAQRVKMVGNVPQDGLRDYYGSADVLVLASSREGWPNVLLECMACGTPVVATNVGGIPEIVTSERVGRIVGSRTAEAIAAAVQDVLNHPRDTAELRSHAEHYSWESTTANLLRLFTNARPAHLSGQRPPLVSALL